MKTKKQHIINIILINFFLFCLVSINFAQNKKIAIKEQNNECLKDFDYLVNKIKNNYPGYNDKVTKETSNDLKQLEKTLREKISLYPDSCGKYFNDYTSWFKDYHLRVRRVWSNKNNNTNATIPKFIILNKDSIKFLSEKKRTIEGIWTSHQGDIAIIKNPVSEIYSGIVIKYNGYEANQVIFEFKLVDENNFKFTSFYFYNGFKPQSGNASLHLDEKILELHEDSYFVRKSDSYIYTKALLYTYQPLFPNGTNTYPLSTYLSDSTYYLRIPSFSNNCADILVNKHWQEIISRPNLIIDIRNNGGGQDNYYQILSKLLYTNPYKSKGIVWYATKDNIKFYEDAIKNGEIRNGEEGLKWVNALLSEMKKNIGGFVVHPMMGSDNIVTKDTIYKYPKRIGIIINEGNGSSSEQFLLCAKESKKVILFGNHNTAGVLDYSNAVSENFPSGKFELSLPMSKSNRLPENPIDNIGIAPDIIIPFPATEQLFDNIDSWAKFVKNYLENL